MRLLSFPFPRLYFVTNLLLALALCREAEMSDRESIEDADEAIEREARRKKDRSKGKSKKRDSSSEPEEKEEAGAAPRRRLVVESDEDE